MGARVSVVGRCGIERRAHGGRPSHRDRHRLPALPLILIAFLLAAAALAQDVQYAVAFESVGGDPVDSDSFASGDVTGLRVDLHNGSDAALQPGAFWVAFPPVESATLFGNAGNGFSFPTGYSMQRART